jgi:hypothetical protein
MKKRVRSLWISFKNTPLFGANLCGYGSDREALRYELAGVEENLRSRPRSSVLMDLDLAQTDLCPEIIAFLVAHNGQEDDPVRKMGIIGVSAWQRWWWPRRWFQKGEKVRWPRHARFFEGHEPAKEWLIKEVF